jgi:hypothetical protein
MVREAKAKVIYFKLDPDIRDRVEQTREGRTMKAQINWLIRSYYDLLDGRPKGKR